MDQLKKLLEELNAGTITLAAYKRKAAVILSGLVDDGTITDDEYDAEIAKVNEQKEPAAGGAGDDDQEEREREAERKAQAAADRVRTEEAKKRKKLEQELEILRQANMSEKEKQEHATKQLEEKQKELQRKEVRLHAISFLQENNLPSSFLEFVIAEDEESTTERISTMRSLFDKEVQTRVKQQIAGSGTDPNKGKGGGAGSGGSSDPNPWKKGSIDLAEQERIILKDPDLAARLRREAQ